MSCQTHQELAEVRAQLARASAAIAELTRERDEWRKIALENKEECERAERERDEAKADTRRLDAIDILHAEIEWTGDDLEACRVDTWDGSRISRAEGHGIRAAIDAALAKGERV